MSINSNDIRSGAVTASRITQPHRASDPIIPPMNIVEGGILVFIVGGLGFAFGVLAYLARQLWRTR